MSSNASRMKRRSNTNASPNFLDAGSIYLDDIYTSTSVARKVDQAKTAEKGRIVLQDTNNTSVDFEKLTPPVPRRYLDPKQSIPGLEPAVRFFPITSSQQTMTTKLKYSTALFAGALVLMQLPEITHAQEIQNTNAPKVATAIPDSLLRRLETTPAALERMEKR